MERTIKCVKFQSKRMLESAAVFTMIYLFFYVVLVAAIVENTKTRYFNGGFFFSSFFFGFVVLSSLYKNTFNSLMMFGNTRRTILASFYLTCIEFSAILAVLSELFELLSLGLSHAFKFVSMSTVSSFYNNTNPFEEALWFFTFFLVVNMIAYIYGALCYKIGKLFKIIFWCGFGLLMMLAPLFSIKGVYATVVNDIKSFLAYNSSNGIYICSLHFLIVAIILGLILWLIAHRQPQKA